MTVVLAAVLGVLRPSITSVWIDAVTDGAWGGAQQRDVEALLAVEQRSVRAGQRRTATSMGIDLDLTRDVEFGLLVRLSAYSIHAEAWAQSEPVFSASDTGDHLWFALTPGDATQAASCLSDLGYAFEDHLVFRR